MKLATWNVNSLRARRERVLDWIARAQPDVLCLQETKVIDEDFPAEEFQRLGYTVSFSGQQSYNGVAILARALQRDVARGLVDEREDDGRRLISATIGKLRVYSAYVPNGKHLEHPDFQRKLEWLGRLKATLAAARNANEQLVVCGDFNVAREDRDVFDPDAMRGQLHFHPLEHAAMHELEGLGLVDAFRLKDQRGGQYSWWDYRAGAFRRNRGLRIDYIFMEQGLAERCSSASMDVQERAQPNPSDHCPVVVEFDLTGA